MTVLYNDSIYLGLKGGYVWEFSYGELCVVY